MSIITRHFDKQFIFYFLHLTSQKSNHAFIFLYKSTKLKGHASYCQLVHLQSAVRVHLQKDFYRHYL